MVIINKTEIRIVSLARSGHHGIINWIIGQCPGKVCYLNGVKPYKNPYFTYVDKELKNINEQEFVIDRKKRYKNIKKDYLIYSYEELPLREIFNTAFEKNHDKYLGKSSKKFDILVLRDPFNYFASRMKLEGMGLLDPNIRTRLVNKKSRNILTHLWKDYAKEYFGKTDYLKNNKIVINFNKWSEDQSYRKELARKLHLKFSDRRMNKMTRAGPGSSFDKLKYVNDGGKMKVLERWKVMKNYPFYRAVFKDKGLVNLSNKIFGKIEGTGIILTKQNFVKNVRYNLSFKLLLLRGKTIRLIKKVISPIRNLLIHQKT